MFNFRSLLADFTQRVPSSSSCPSAIQACLDPARVHIVLISSQCNNHEKMIKSKDLRGSILFCPIDKGVRVLAKVEKGATQSSAIS